MLGSLLQRLAALQGYYSQMPRYYAPQIRGGGSAVKLGIDTEMLSLPKDRLDLLLCFDWAKYIEFAPELQLGAGSVILYEKDPPPQASLPSQSTRIQIDFSKESENTTGSARNKNIVALGLLEKTLGLPENGLAKAIEEDENLRLLKQQITAYEAGQALCSRINLPPLALASPRDDLPKIVLHGNKAVAQGAISAGCQTFFGYPITPASEIMEEMQNELPHMNGAFLQAEDEIASAGMIVGAALTGAKSMTSTSGPGFDLMTEMMGLASAIEVPLVIVDVQRGGPSTGLPSKLEQSDLNHAIYGGHGDAPRVVLAAYDVPGCYRLAIESFNISQYYQVPVILLTDQWLGQTFVATDDDFMDGDSSTLSAKRPHQIDKDNYCRYKKTEDFISPMAFVGDDGFIYQTTGLTHNEKGHPSINSESHQWLHEKRWKKLNPLRERKDLVKIIGEEEPRAGIISWGSSAQVVMQAVSELGLQHKVSICIPEIIHPLPTAVERFVQSVKRLLVVELNYSGQLYHYLRSQTHLPAKSVTFARPGGSPFSRAEISQQIEELLI